jgi:hypothetical protein
MSKYTQEDYLEQQVIDLQDSACVLSHVIDDIKRISHYIDFLVNDISYLNNPNCTFNKNDFSLSFDILRIQKLFNDFKLKYKKDFDL